MSQVPRPISSATLRQDMTGILLAHSYFLRLDPKQ